MSWPLRGLGLETRGNNPLVNLVGNPLVNLVGILAPAFFQNLLSCHHVVEMFSDPTAQGQPDFLAPACAEGCVGTCLRQSYCSIVRSGGPRLTASDNHGKCSGREEYFGTRLFARAPSELVVGQKL